MLLEGIFVPVTTPFRHDGRLFAAKLEANVDHYGRTPAAGLMVLGENSEAAALTDEEAREVLAVVGAAAAREQVLLAEVARPGVAATLSLAEQAAQAGFDAVCLSAPEAEMAHRDAYVACVADRSPLPVVLRLPLSAAELSAPVLRWLEHPNVLGVLDEASSAERVQALRERAAAVSREVTVTQIFRAVTRRMARMASGSDVLSAASLRLGAAQTPGAGEQTQLKTRVKRLGLQILAGRAQSELACLQAGAGGAVMSLAACAPQACCEIYQAFRDGDPGLAAEKQDRVDAAMRQLSGAARIKYGCDVNGYFGGPPRLPALPLLGAERLAVEQVLAGMRN